MAWSLALALFAPGLNMHQAGDQPSQAEGTIVSQEDLDGDGMPDLTILAASFATFNDRIYVYDGARNMNWGSDWQTVVDFDDDTWIFDAQGDSSAQLVIQFSREGELAKASLFDDQTGDGRVALKVNGVEVTVTESAYPVVTVMATGGWFLPDGQLNWNVRFQTDGSSVSHIDTYDLTDHWKKGNRLVLDGKPDIELEFRDQDGDGIPEYGLWRLLTPSSKDEGAVRTWIWSNEGRHRPAQPTGYFFWPYLLDLNLENQVANGAAQPQNRNYFDVPPWIWVNFIAGRVLSVNFPGYPIEQGFHVNTLQYFEKGKTNYADFENAQAYYDLANNRDGYPELHIRHRYYAPLDLYGWNLNSPVEEIRWSWKQNITSDLTWDYKLGLAGRHTITTEIKFPDFSYGSIPYADLPAWVIGNRWDYASFVARESVKFQSTEGIYFWGAVEQVLDNDPRTLSRYLVGELVVDPCQAFTTLPSGWRGDCASTLNTQPYLYFSMVDHKLHLLKASEGTWNIDGAHEIHYENLSGDHINKWTLLENGNPIKSLYTASGYVIYADASGVQLVRTDTPPALFTTLPPRNRDEWAQLGANLDEHKPTFAPDDFAAMFAQFDGPRFLLAGAALRDFRLTPDGFRFVLELQPGFHMDGDVGLDLTGLKPGTYVVTYNGKFAVQPFTPAQPEIETGTLRLSNPTPTELEPVQIEALIHNAGLEDLPGLHVRASAMSPGSPSQVITETQVALLAGHSVPVRFDWTPPVPGDWQVMLAWDAAEGQSSLTPTSTNATLNVRVRTQPPLDLATIWRISNVSQPVALALLLACLGLSAAALAAATLRAGSRWL